METRPSSRQCEDATYLTTVLVGVQHPASMGVVEEMEYCAVD
jgi:hypothetical protein